VIRSSESESSCSVKRMKSEEGAYHSRKQEGDEEIAWQRRKVEIDRPTD